MEEMDAFTYREKLAGDSIFFIPVGALEQHGSHMAMCVDAALTKTMAGETAKALEAATNGKVNGIVTAPINYGFRSQQRSGGSCEQSACRGCGDKRAILAAMVCGSVLGKEHGGAGILACGAKALDAAQRKQQHRGGDADGLERRKAADEERCGGHAENGDG